MTQYEIIDVVGRYQFVDGAGRMRRYATADGRPLPDGYYVVFDTDLEGDLYFDRSTRYQGPYPAELTSRTQLEKQVRSWLPQSQRPQSVRSSPGMASFTMDWEM